MSLLLQGVLVGLIVGCCLVFAAWRLASVTLRLRVLEALGALPGALTTPWLARLRARTLERAAGACAGCASGGGLKTEGNLRRDAGSPNRTPGALRR
ncbi:MAG: hypothetical protein WA747_01095 [Steroidobacteraceae bacterium]